MRHPIHLIAKTAFSHHGRTVVAGEAFTASPIEAAALRYQRKAIFAPTGSAAVRPRAPAPVPVSQPEVTDADPAPRRRYRRHDLVAED
jgi:hypothetical protein